MGGEGHIFAMISSLKNNSRGKNKGFDAWRKKNKVKLKLKFNRKKKVSDEKLQELRTNYRLKRKKLMRKEILLFLVALIIALFIISRIYPIMF